MDEIDVDGMETRQGHRLIGKAQRQENGMYKCLAIVGECLCLVEVRVTMLDNQNS